MNAPHLVELLDLGVCPFEQRPFEPREAERLQISFLRQSPLLNDVIFSVGHLLELLADVRDEHFAAFAITEHSPLAHFVEAMAHGGRWTKDRAAATAVQPRALVQALACEDIQEVPLANIYALYLLACDVMMLANVDFIQFVAEFSTSFARTVPEAVVQDIATEVENHPDLLDLAARILARFFYLHEARPTDLRQGHEVPFLAEVRALNLQDTLRALDFLGELNLADPDDNLALLLPEYLTLTALPWYQVLWRKRYLQHLPQQITQDLWTLREEALVLRLQVIRLQLHKEGWELQRRPPENRRQKTFSEWLKLLAICWKS